MATVVNQTPTNSNSGLGIVIALVLALAVIFAFLYFGTSLFRQTSPQLNVPDQVDVNISTPNQ